MANEDENIRPCPDNQSFIVTLYNKFTIITHEGTKQARNGYHIRKPEPK